MEKLTTWRPLTCSCEIVYSWDSDVPENNRTHTIVSHAHCGEKHAVGLPGETLEASAFFKDYKALEHARLKFAGKVTR